MIEISSLGTGSSAASRPMVVPDRVKLTSGRRTGPWGPGTTTRFDRFGLISVRAPADLPAAVSDVVILLGLVFAAGVPSPASPSSSLTGIEPLPPKRLGSGNYRRTLSSSAFRPAGFSAGSRAHGPARTR